MTTIEQEQTAIDPARAVLNQPPARQPGRSRRAEPPGGGDPGPGARRLPAGLSAGGSLLGPGAEGAGRTVGLAGELEHGRRSLAEVQAGLERFRGGAGRHGTFEARAG